MKDPKGAQTGLKAKLVLEDKEYELPIFVGTEGEKAIDISSLRKATELVLDVHLLIERPERYAVASAVEPCAVVRFRQELERELRTQAEVLGVACAAAVARRVSCCASVIPCERPRSAVVEAAAPAPLRDWTTDSTTAVTTEGPTVSAGSL